MFISNLLFLGRHGVRVVTEEFKSEHTHTHTIITKILDKIKFVLKMTSIIIHLHEMALIFIDTWHTS